MFNLKLSFMPRRIWRIYGRFNFLLWIEFNLRISANADLTSLANAVTFHRSRMDQQANLEHALNAWLETTHADDGLSNL